MIAVPSSLRIKKHVLAIPSFNAWYASSLISQLSNRGFKRAIILTEPELVTPIKKLIDLAEDKYIALEFVFTLADFVRLIDCNLDVLLICDHPLRNHELSIFKSVDKNIKIFKMTHGLSDASGSLAVKQIFTHAVRKLFFFFLTRRHEVSQVVGNKASGYIYLNWLSKISKNLVSKNDPFPPAVLFASSGAGRYENQEFREDTASAFKEAYEKAKLEKVELFLMAKHKEDLSYLKMPEDIKITFVHGGLPHIVNTCRRKFTAICYNQSTMVQEIQFLNLPGWTYRARFDDQIAYKKTQSNSSQTNFLEVLDKNSWIKDYQHNASIQLDYIGKNYD